MITKEALSKIETLEECQQYLKKELVKYKTLYNQTYSDYEKKCFTEQVKAYEGETNYVVVISNLEGVRVKNLKVYVTKEKPLKPHPLFPVPMGFVRQAKSYSFGQETDFEKKVDIEDRKVDIDACVDAIKLKKQEA